MPKNNTKEKPNPIYTLMQNYGMSTVLGNLNLLVGHPADRLKVAMQINPDKACWSIIKPIITDGFKNIYRGFQVSFYRQNTKIIHRTAILSATKWVDGYNFNIIFGSALKGLLASSVDTFITTPFENIKTRQMKAIEKISILETTKSIYKNHGAQGFFSGAPITLTKACPTWIYLFLGYHATKDKRDNKGFLATLFWATVASIPITLITNPLDVIKSQRQGELIPKSQYSLDAARQLVKDFGPLILFRGFEYRLLHKALATLVGYMVLANSENFQSDTLKSGTTNECKM